MPLITEENLDRHCRTLAGRSAVLEGIHRKHGTPPLWAREPNFESLVRIILEQQVSLASAFAAFNKLREMVGEITPEAVLSLSDREMKAAYFSRQKTVYARELARVVLEGDLDLESLAELPDSEIRVELMKVKGIGRWTADIYLLMAMGRPDVMPKGDLALIEAYKTASGLEQRPDADSFDEHSRRWHPLRSVAARLLWHFYLSDKKNRVSRRQVDNPPLDGR